jgi:pimeloyl-ACP methyl ester carboxylesterase
MLARSGLGAAVDALLLAGLPARPEAGSAASWEEELSARTTLDGLRMPILGIRGRDDPISPLGQVRDRYAAAPSAELVRITAGRHDVLNDQTHRTVAAIVVLFLERIRQDSGPRPIAVQEQQG